jgi:hypothetical protein
VDACSCHVSKKSMKKFVSKLFGSFLSLLKRNCIDVSFWFVEKQMENGQKIVTMEDTSSKLIRNLVHYEKQFFCRKLESYLCENNKKRMKKLCKYFCNVPDLASLGNNANVCVGSKVYSI